MPSTFRVAIFASALVAPVPAGAEQLTTCPSAQVQAEIRASAGSSIDALTSAVADVERRYGPAHSRKRVSDDEVRLIYRSGKGAISVSLARDDTGRIATDCVAY